MPTSVVVAGGMLDGMPVGMVIGSFTSVSIDPPLVGFFGDARSTTLEPLLRCANLTFSLLGQEDLAVCEAFRLPLHQRFDAVAWSQTGHGTAAIDNAALTVHTRVYRTFEAGDHTCVLAEVLGIGIDVAVRRPLVFFKRQLTRLDPGRVLAEELWQLGWQEPH
ncbi:MULTISPECIES: flavin reductase family protein [Mycolicibacterium]|uniref:flavin reductase family protein n=1 Tax=Mycolicibacterium TaxID=1866885 RepID=UPI001427B0FE|nr:MULTISPECIES: flavin reductase family protein [Mycolicibacterium]MCV7336078.1 flavin reductase [Mycolicibacterium senegalense]MDR7287916.1 flavin reductase (DIM6/NTAB) family NADH-FMN oxidoreductase RutF [Mycolicibacterium senegalense]QZA24919.1 flavin reductase family protein [Mycolicibacterium senegalense]